MQKCDKKNYGKIFIAENFVTIFYTVKPANPIGIDLLLLAK